MIFGLEDQSPPVNKVKEERIKVAINPEHPEQTVMIGSNLTEKTKTVYAKEKDAKTAERNVAINDEVSKLVKAGIMREVYYHDWLSNPVMVKKSDDSWRMCVDFKDLNKACPKDGYLLPEIDWKVESLCGFPFNAFQERIQVVITKYKWQRKMRKNAFITNQEEAEATFKQMKEHIAKLPMAHRPEELRGTHCPNQAASYVGGEQPSTNDRKEPGRSQSTLPRVSVKGQVLADFIVERPEDEGQDNSAKEEEPLPALWTLFTNGSSCVDGCGAGVILTDPASQEQETEKADALSKMASTSFAHLSKQVLGGGIERKIRKRKRGWKKSLTTLGTPATMIKSSNGDTPFSLTYGTEVVIPAEIEMPTFRTAEVDIAENDEALEINLDLIKEKREQAAIREAKSKRQKEKYYNTKVRNANFKPGDLVYRSNEASRVEDTGKLGPKWEGPYEVTEALRKGSYKLKDRNGKEVPRTWNVCNFKKCYIYKM
ncbi:reverse transcriptase domain-containing protein [Tanacetum coccineum]|uniref:Reverse transcriptase domain-containing protein n=1 Tax=Tanacetum coccineum TaxID=301880 RepID=A0ABQ4ZF35_9ASTR